MSIEFRLVCYTTLDELYGAFLNPANGMTNEGSDAEPKDNHSPETPREV